VRSVGRVDNAPCRSTTHRAAVVSIIGLASPAEEAADSLRVVPGTRVVRTAAHGDKSGHRL